MAVRDPYAVLGIEPGSSPAAIKGAWRRLARAHHPDVAGDAASRREATKKMAEINAAYEQLRHASNRTRPAAHAANGSAGAAAERAEGTNHADGEARPSGPPPPPPTRPVTARLDTTELFRPRNATTTPHGGGYRHRPRGHVPQAARPEMAEPPRASTPTGPVRPAGHRRAMPPPPSLVDASQTPIAFGKFHGQTLGDIAAREPLYLAWLVRTITRDPDLVAAARVILADLGIEVSAAEVRGARRAAAPSGA